MPKYVWKLRRGTGFSLIRIFSYRFPCEARFTRTGLRVKSERTEYMYICGGVFVHASSMLRTAEPVQRTKNPCQTSLQLTRSLVRSSV